MTAQAPRSRRAWRWAAVAIIGLSLGTAALMAGIALTASRPGEAIATPLAASLRAAAARDGVVNWRTGIPGTWTALHLFPRGATAEQIRACLGFDWPGAADLARDMARANDGLGGIGLALTKDGEMVAATHRLGLQFDLALAPPGCRVPRDAAVFALRPRAGSHPRSFDLVLRPAE